MRILIAEDDFSSRGMLAAMLKKARNGRVSHHLLLAFISDFRLNASFWLRPGNAHSYDVLRTSLN